MKIFKADSARHSADLQTIVGYCIAHPPYAWLTPKQAMKLWAKFSNRHSDHFGNGLHKTMGESWGWQDPTPENLAMFCEHFEEIVNYQPAYYSD